MGGLGWRLVHVMTISAKSRARVRHAGACGTVRTGERLVRDLSAIRCTGRTRWRRDRLKWSSGARPTTGAWSRCQARAPWWRPCPVPTRGRRVPRGAAADPGAADHVRVRAEDEPAHEVVGVVVGRARRAVPRRRDRSRSGPPPCRPRSTRSGRPARAPGPHRACPAAANPAASRTCVAPRRRPSDRAAALCA